MSKRYPYIYRKKSGIHNYGVFAAKDIPAGERVVQYTGQKMTYAVAEKKPNQDYLFELNSRYQIDGRNIARYVNHSCDPNCDSDVTGGKIWIIAWRDIEKGEEITYNYGYTIKEGLKYPCLCGQKNCIGYILHYDHWDRFKRLKKQKKLKLV